MNKISCLDIRVAVLAYPLVTKEETTFVREVRRVVPFSGDDRIVSVFQNAPKAYIEPSRSKIPPLLRKGQFVLIRLLEVCKTLLEQREESRQVLADVAPPRKLLAPQLPHPPFHSNKPPRFFWHPAYVPPQEGYADGMFNVREQRKPTDARLPFQHHLPFCS